MKVFLDTSSLLKLYHHEVGTEKLLNILSQGVEEIYLSELAILEFHSAIWKKVRTSKIEVVTAKAVITCFQTDYTQFRWIQLDSKVIQLGRELLMKYGTTGLRTLDAIQLASALALKEQPKIYFFTADQLLQSFFEQEGLATIL